MGYVFTHFTHTNLPSNKPRQRTWTAPPAPPGTENGGGIMKHQSRPINPWGIDGEKNSVEVITHLSTKKKTDGSPAKNRCYVGFREGIWWFQPPLLDYILAHYGSMGMYGIFSYMNGRVFYGFRVGKYTPYLDAICRNEWIRTILLS